MIEWGFDGTVNVEGLATAAAAVGAATVYIFDLIGRRLREHRNRQRGNRGRMILELVQRDFVDGLPESAIYHALQSGDADAVNLRRIYGVPVHDNKPKTRQEVEAHLIQMVYERLIEIDAPDHFRISGSQYYLSDRERREKNLRNESRKRILAGLRRELISRLKARSNDPTLSEWDRADIFERLIELDEQTTAESLLANADQAPAQIRARVEMAIARYLTREY